METSCGRPMGDACSSTPSARVRSNSSFRRRMATERPNASCRMPTFNPPSSWLRDGTVSYVRRPSAEQARTSGPCVSAIAPAGRSLFSRRRSMADASRPTGVGLPIRTTVRNHRGLHHDAIRAGSSMAGIRWWRAGSRLEPGQSGTVFPARHADVRGASRCRRAIRQWSSERPVRRSLSLRTEHPGLPNYDVAPDGRFLDDFV